MGHSYIESKKIANKTIVILAVITVFEVFLALVGKGYIIDGVELPHMLMGGLMIILSAYKAFLIVYEFMHMKYEMPGLRRTVLVPTTLLIWALISFLYEGNYWGIQARDNVSVDIYEDVKESSDSDVKKDAHEAHDHNHDHDHDDHSGEHHHGHDH